MYKLVVESGSTKTDWVVITPQQDVHFSTPGINPSANKNIYDLAEAEEKLLAYRTKIETIHYFGAGVINDETRLVVKEWLSNYFSHFTEFQIESDLLGAAIATAGNKKGIISILGTGSNSCVYDGHKITNNVPALGFILSNEGGGSKIGANLIKAYFYNQLPEIVRSEFDQMYSLSKDRVIQELYQGHNPTAYLASFAQFLNLTSDKKWRKSYLSNIFQEYIDIRIKQYSEYLDYDLHFVGSIAYFYADVLKEVLKENNLSCTSIHQKPITGLVDFFK